MIPSQCRVPVYPATFRQNNPVSDVKYPKLPWHTFLSFLSLINTSNAISTETFFRIAKMNDNFSALEEMDDEELSQELREATEDSNLQQVQFLIRFMNEYSPGFFLNHKDPFDHTNALFCAVGKSDIPITTLLLQHGADPNKVNGFESLTPLHVATSHHIIQLLIGANARRLNTSSYAFIK